MTDTEYIRLSLSLTEKERADLDRYAKCCGLSHNAFIRQLILGKTPRPKQPEEFWAFIFVLTPYPFGTERNITIPNPSASGSWIYLTVFAGNMACLS